MFCSAERSTGGFVPVQPTEAAQGDAPSRPAYGRVAASDLRERKVRFDFVR